MIKFTSIDMQQIEQLAFDVNTPNDKADKLQRLLITEQKNSDCPPQKQVTFLQDTKGEIWILKSIE